MTTATIFDIQKYSLHNGPGIRTTIFFKGCPLSCWWCHNPESQAAQKELMYYEDRCLFCGSCVESCPEEALSMTDKGLKVDESICTLCAGCIRECPAGALEIAGREATLKEVIAETTADRLFYEQSGGGITFSGGEPLKQFAFVKELAEYYQNNGIHTVLDTCGLIEEQKVLEIAPLIDLFFYDIKFIDSRKHQRFTGQSNEQILNNLSKIAAKNYNITVRIPVIPGINDREAEMKKIGEFLVELGIDSVHLLGYHRSGIHKYSRLDKQYRLPDISSPGEDRILGLEKILKEMNLNTKIRS